ncbi:4Fe-4S dicluster domain-containing protein [Bacteroides thetaiotaomicron]|uniref:4Fe-4S dicluster domain-containing protein n=1 Tax=Bacteroides thetaiotaomicron TaxID=818 RepID=UPI0039C3935B
MIEIIDKHNCCGCSACVQACPKQCISFDEDDQGFRYPLVNKKLCIDCHLCEKVCPCLNQNEPRKPLIAYAAINPNDDIRMESSSGGIFTMLAEVVIDEGGVVFGVRFDESWEAIHDYTEKKRRLVCIPRIKVRTEPCRL